MSGFQRSLGPPKNYSGGRAYMVFINHMATAVKNKGKTSLGFTKVVAQKVW